MKRRDFMVGLGVAAALPAMSRAQRATPTIGFLSTRSPDEAAIHTTAFRSGLEEMGYVEGKSVAIEYRWAKGDYGKLPGFAAELLSKPLALMVAAGDPAALAAKAAAPSIPIVFLVGGDPVQSGLVMSMNRPGAARHEAGRSSGAATDEVRTRHQHQDRKDAWPCGPAIHADRRR
jgi:putative ABC transport system substrate-binding protein